MASNRPTAVVTGATRGIGRAIALRLSREHDVWALGRGEAELASLATETNGAVRPLRVDVGQPEEIRAACRRISTESGAVAVLVNNAGIALSAPLRKTTLEEYERIQDVNTRAPFLFCQELMPAMAEARRGRVINVASTAAVKGFRYTSAYCASKHALLGLTRALAVEFAGKNVTVNAVCPGWTDTDMLTRSADAISRATGRSHGEARDALANMNPMQRLIRPEEVAELCAFLTSDAAAAITGATYLIDGGEAL